MFASIRTTLLVALVGLQLILAGVIISSSFVTSETAVLRQAEQLMTAIANDTIRHTRGFLREAETAVHLTKGLHQGEVLEQNESTNLERLFFEQLKLSPTISGLYYGDSEGQFTYVSRSTKEGKTEFQTKLITTDNERAEFIFRDSGFEQVAANSIQEDPYDPRTRPWYTDAIEQNGLAWTAPYIFYTSQQPGITVAAPVTTPEGEISGVIGIDMEIDAISKFLANLVIGESGAAFILTTDGDVIAHPDSAKIKKFRDNGEDGLRFAKIDELQDPISLALMETISSDAGNVDFSIDRFARFDVNGMVYDAVFRPFTIGDLDWSIAVYAPESDFLGSIIEGRTLNIIIAISIACITALLGLLLARQITRPLTALSQCADEIARGEPSNTAALPENFVELKRVSTAFRRMSRWLDGYQAKNNQMNRELADSAKMLEIRVEDLHQEIADRKRAEAQSQQLQNELAHVTRFSTTGEMAASLAHELNQPLTAITQYCDLLLSGTGRDQSSIQEVKECVEEMQDQAFRAGEIIRELRQFIRKGETDAEPVNLSKLITQTVRLIEPQARESDIDIIIDTDETAPDILINRVQIAQVLVNLLRNSVEAINSAESEDRVISVRASQEGTSAEIIVEDSGPGLTSSDNAFKPFETSKSDGMGMGLSISRSIVEAHQGRLTADTKVRKGARFIISLPGLDEPIALSQ